LLHNQLFQTKSALLPNGDVIFIGDTIGEGLVEGLKLNNPSTNPSPIVSPINITSPFGSNALFVWKSWLCVNFSPEFQSCFSL
jgi:hypothetical protein